MGLLVDSGMGQVVAVCELRCLYWAGNHSHLQSPSVYAGGFYTVFPKACNVYPLGLTYLMFLRFIYFLLIVAVQCLRCCSAFSLAVASAGCPSLRCLGSSRAALVTVPGLGPPFLAVPGLRAGCPSSRCLGPRGLPFHCGAWASRCGSFSCCGA